MFVRGVATGLGIALGFTAAFSDAQPYPTKTVRIIVPYAPGGPTDIVARLLGQRMSETWGQPVVADNRAGANGNIAAELVAKAAPDGHTLFIGNTSVLTINPHTYKKIAYDPIKDFTPISLVVAAPLVLVVHPSLPAKDVKGLVALARSKPGELAYASSGRGGISHLAAELFRMSTGTSLIHVAYKGAGLAANDVYAGQVALSFTSAVSTMHHVNAGRLRALGVTSAKRQRTLPQVPAIAETVPGYEVDPWYGVLAPAGLPEAIVKRVHAEIVRIAKLPDVGPRLTADGGDVVANAPGEFAAIIKQELDKWGTVVRQAGVDLQ
jgi:tripartite-type tricarboxylate transporter receptor subunit TctC